MRQFDLVHSGNIAEAMRHLLYLPRNIHVVILPWRIRVYSGAYWGSFSPTPLLFPVPLSALSLNCPLSLQDLNSSGCVVELWCWSLQSVQLCCRTCAAIFLLFRSTSGCFTHRHLGLGQRKGDCWSISSTLFNTMGLTREAVNNRFLHE